MNERCARSFEESLLSGYLDGALTQGDEQRVRLHLEGCAACRELVAELGELREVTLGTRFRLPDPGTWDERPRGARSRWLRRLGWLAVGIATLALAVVAAGEAVRAPGAWWEKAILGVGGAGVAALFLSVLIDRLGSLDEDRYRGVRK